MIGTYEINVGASAGNGKKLAEEEGGKIINNLWVILHYSVYTLSR